MWKIKITMEDGSVETKRVRFSGIMTLWILETRTGEVAEVLTCDKHSSQMPRPDGDMVQAYDCEDEVECDFCNKNDITWESKSDGMVRR